MSASASFFPPSQPPPSWHITPALPSSPPKPPHPILSTPPPPPAPLLPHNNPPPRRLPTLEIEELPSDVLPPSDLEILYPDAYEDYQSPDNHGPDDDDDEILFARAQSPHSLDSPSFGTPLLASSSGRGHINAHELSSTASTRATTPAQLTRATTPSTGTNEKKRKLIDITSVTHTPQDDGTSAIAASEPGHDTRRVRRRKLQDAPREIDVEARDEEDGTDADAETMAVAEDMDTSPCTSTPTLA